MTGDHIIALCLGIGNFIISVLVVVISSFLFNKNEKIYMRRQEAIYDAMKFLDNRNRLGTCHFLFKSS